MASTTATASRSNTLKNPHRTLLDLYAAEDDVDVDAFPLKVAAHFDEIFSSVDAFNEIPVLDVHRPPKYHADRSLVRFRAMVQDTSPSLEIYLAKRRNGHTSGWGLFADTVEGRDEEQFDYSDLRECSVMWAVSVPGESDWCKDSIPNLETDREPHQILRPHKYPVPEASHIGVQLKLYDNDNASSIKSTDVCTFVGILTHEADDQEAEDVTLQVPTLHVLFSKPLPRSITPRPYPSTTVLRTDQPHPRQALIEWIATEALAGDKVAAEWVLLCALSKVQSRNPPILPPSLSLVKFPSPTDDPNSSRQPILPHVLSLIFPTVTHIPLSLSTLNSTSFCPESKDEDLHSGWLQVPSGSVLCISESGVREGGVSEKGIMNLRAIQEVMNNQTLDYVFPYSRFTFQTDAACIVLCEGRKSTFFQTSITVPLQPNLPEAEALVKLYQSPKDVKLPSDELLEAFRAWVGGAKMGNVTVGEQVGEYIQTDFVKDRKENKEGMTSEDLIRRLNIARLVALSHHSPEVTVEIWEETKMLEAARSKRLATLS